MTILMRMVLWVSIPLALAAGGQGPAHAQAADAPTLYDTLLRETGTAIAQEFKAPSAQVQFTDPAFAARLAAVLGASPRLSLITLDKVTGRFEVLLRPAQDNPALPPQILAGHAKAMVRLPVLARDMRAGDVLQEADVSEAELPLGRVSSNALRSKAELLGFAARRPLRAGTPVDASDLRRPVLVAKGTLVTIRFALPGIELSVQGQAQADGGAGEPIAVLNTATRRTLQARVVAAGLVEVSPAAAPQLAAAPAPAFSPAPAQ